MKKIPQTKQEWIAYGNRATAAKKRQIQVYNIPLDEVDTMWFYENQAKRHNQEGKLMEILASDSLNNLKKEVKNKKWKVAWLTTKSGNFSSGQYAVEEYPYIPKY